MNLYLLELHDSVHSSVTSNYVGCNKFRPVFSHRQENHSRRANQSSAKQCSAVCNTENRHGL